MGKHYKTLPLRYRRKVSKEEINQLPIRKWSGKIELIRSVKALAKIKPNLEKETFLGFDTETRPAFRKGVFHRPALLQLAGSKVVYLIQLKNLYNYDMLCDILEDRKIFKVGVGLSQDIQQLQSVFSFRAQGFIDLGQIAEKADIQSRGLRSMAASLLGFRISKRAQCSNWAHPKLQPFQITYAATDAWVSREIFLFMRNHDLIDPNSKDYVNLI
ncbi:3'-5' exonuclease [Magnetococcales bacterium HHB-1]